MKKIKYCKKHKQVYQNNLRQCPICGGENYIPSWIEKEDKTKEEDKDK